MCLGENNAPHAISHLNSQLYTAWKISSECAAHYGTDFKPDINYRYSIALARFHYGRHRVQATMEDLMFYASFEAPTLEFICNHEAKLRITIKNGHYNTDYRRASEARVADKKNNKDVSNMSLVFRVPFRNTAVEGTDAEMWRSGGRGAIHVFVFNYTDAKLVETPLDTGAQTDWEALELYLLAYLAFLQSVGHHVLFSLPTFGDKSLRPFIDFSQNNPSLQGLDHVRGVSLDKIKSYLFGSWLKSFMGIPTQKGQPYDRSTVSLAEYRGQGVAQSYFHLKLGVPEVAPLCADEVMVTFIVDEADFYESQAFEGQPAKTFSNWKVSVLVNIIYEQEDQGHTTRIKLDITSRRPVSQPLPAAEDSEGDGSDVQSEEFNQVVRFLGSEFYFSLLRNAQYHILYEYDSRIPSVDDATEQLEQDDDMDDVLENMDLLSAFDEQQEIESGDGKDWLDIADLGGFDQITVLPLRAVNLGLRFAWKEQAAATGTGEDALLVSWQHGELFNSTFMPPTVRLRSNGRANILINLDSGSCTLPDGVLSSEGEAFDFTEWRVTFEVDVKMCDHSSLADTAPDWQSGAFTRSAAYKEHGHSSDVKFKHVYLDLQNAEFQHGLSWFGSSSSSDKRGFVKRVRAVVGHLRDFYLKKLVAAGHHIISTIPVWKSSSCAPPHAFTDVAFAGPQDTSSDVAGEDMQHGRMEALGVLLGICEGRPLPQLPLRGAMGWAAHQRPAGPFGAISLSSDTFLQARLLPLLFDVNAQTTLLPMFSGVQRDKWKLVLKRWSDDTNRVADDCALLRAADNGDSAVLKYKWYHFDEYGHKHEGGSYVMNGMYTVSSRTDNNVEIFTAPGGDVLTIVLSGVVQLELAIKTLDKSWSSSSTAEWKVNLETHFGSDGVRTDVTRAATTFSEAASHGETHHAGLALDPRRLLSDALKDPIRVDRVVEELRVFDRPWPCCYQSMSAYGLVRPILTHRGDLTFQLRPRASEPGLTSDTFALPDGSMPLRN